MVRFREFGIGFPGGQRIFAKPASIYLKFDLIELDVQEPCPKIFNIRIQFPLPSVILMQSNPFYKTNFRPKVDKGCAFWLGNRALRQRV